MDKENKYISFASHAIGLDNKKPYKRHGRLYYRPYRNYYDASPNDCMIWDLMVDAGICGSWKKRQTRWKNILADKTGLRLAGRKAEH